MSVNYNKLIYLIVVLFTTIGYKQTIIKMSSDQMLSYLNTKIQQLIIMKKYYPLLITFFLINSLNAQIIEGNVAVYNKEPYSMDNQESWKRIEIKGGLDFNRKAYINFEDESITFVVVRNSTDEEVYIKSDLVVGGMTTTKYTVLVEIPYITFMTKKEGLEITYFVSTNFKSNQSVFVITDFKSRTMYFLGCNKDVDEIVKKLY